MRPLELVRLVRCHLQRHSRAPDAMVEPLCVVIEAQETEIRRQQTEIQALKTEVRALQTEMPWAPPEEVRLAPRPH